MAFAPIRRFFRLEGRADPVEEEVDAELSFHLDTETARLIQRGLRPEAARQEARRRFGDLPYTRRALISLDQQRRGRMRRAGWLEDLRQDLGYALRGFRRQPGFAALVIVTLGLGIGANATMFGILDRLLFRPPSFLIAPERTGRIWLHSPGENSAERIDNNIAYRRYLDLREGTTALETSAAFFDDAEHVVGIGEETRQLGVELASASIWGMFAVRPVLGRFFTEAEDTPPSGATVVVLAYDYWISAYGGDRAVLGKQLYLGSRPYTIIGVAPQGYQGMSPSKLAAFIPITAGASDGGFGSDWATTYGVSWLEIIARRRPGVSPAAVDAELTRVYRQSRLVQGRVREASIARSRAELAPVLYDRGPHRSDSARVAIWLSGVSLIVLLIVCANVANLLLARGLRRRREMAVRVALGAGKRRLLRQLLSETILLALLGGAAGLALAHFGGGVLRTTLLSGVDWSRTPLFDRRVLLFTGLCALLTGVLTGIVPALHARRGDLTVALKSGGRGASEPRARLRAGLLVLQAALSVTLLVGSGLFVRSLRNVSAVDLGYEPRKMLVVGTDLRGTQLPPGGRGELQGRMLERARGLAGIESAAVTRGIPFWQSMIEDVFVPGRDSINRLGTIYFNEVSEDYFAATGTTVLQGRAFSPGDQAAELRVAILSETMARRVWPEESALGHCIRVGADTMPCAEIVGIVKDVRWGSFGDADRMQVYIPLSRPGRGSLFLRTRGNPRTLVEPVRVALQQLMPGTAFVTVRTLESTLSPVLRPWRLGATMFSLFGGLALLIAAIGLYGVIAYSVAQRLHEMGIRVALGARTGDLLRLVVGEGLRVTLLGVVLGSAAALVAGRLVASLLFNVPSSDPVSFATAALLLLGVAGLASLLPALRAARADPNTALRAE